MARPSLDEIFASKQQKPSLDSIFGSTQQSSPNPQQMAQQASSMPQGVNVPQIPVNPGLGYGMNTMPAISANSMLAPDANKAAIAANIANQAKANAIPIETKQAVSTARATAPIEVQKIASTEQAKNIVGAQQSIARDSANVNMFAGVGRQLMDYYDEAYKNGWAGDKYRAAIGNAVLNGNVPRELSGMLPSSAPVGAFNAISNEWMTRMSPIMQEKFGSDGGSRILQSMLQMAAKETPKLAQPRDSVQAQLGATYKNLMRFALATADYSSRLGNVNIGKDTPQQAVDGVAKKLWNMSSVSPNPGIEKKASDIVAYMTKDNSYQFAKNPTTGEIAIKGKDDNGWRKLGQ